MGTPYMVAKAGAAHLVRQAALELAKHSIRVNAIAPGPFATRITSPGLTAIWAKALPDKGAEFGFSIPAYVEELDILPTDEDAVGIALPMTPGPSKNAGAPA